MVQTNAVKAEQSVPAMSRDIDHLLRPFDFCDENSNVIRMAARNIASGCSSDEGEVARRAFYWVRDSIKYSLGLSADKASETLMKGSGSCTNKANLLVALLRQLGVASGFRVMQVRGNLYFGDLCTPNFAPIISKASLHVYAAAWIGGVWVALDPTDDIELCNATRHLCFQSTPVEFDGQSDARLLLDPEHVISDPDEVLPSVDHILAKIRRAPDVAITVLNRYLCFLRRRAVLHTAPLEIEKAFFAGLQAEDPDVHAAFFCLLGQIGQRAGESARP